MTDVPTTPRGPMGTMRRLRIFEAAHGVCHLCERKIQSGEKWEAEHVRPLALGGADDESNLRPAHLACHSDKTRSDAADIARAKRRKAKHLGIKKTGRPILGSRNTPFKAKIGGGWERRT